MKPKALIGPRASSATLVSLALTVAGSLTVGAMTAASPAATAALLLICIGLCLALTNPTLLFAVGVAFLSIEPSQIFGSDSALGQPQTYKLLLYACVVPLLLGRGVALRKCGPLCAYLVVTSLTELFGTPLPGLTTGQTAASLATLCLAWLIFAVRWDWRRDHPLLKVLAWTPVLSVGVGIALQLAGYSSVFRHTSPPRLEGATIPAWLGSFSVCAAFACLALHRREQWRWARWLGIADVVILGGTLTRGAALALAIVAIPSLTRFARRRLMRGGAVDAAKLGAAIVLAAGCAAVLVPGLLERNQNATVYVAGQGSAHEVASGRFRAWAFAYERVKVNVAFGRGVGAGPIVGRTPGSPADFTAQHNEYLRMWLEVGLVGAIVLLSAIASAMTMTIRGAPLAIRADLAAAAVAFAVYSLTENTLSATPIAVAWLLVLGLVGTSVKRTPGDIRAVT